MSDIKHLRRYVEYNGPVHDDDCPGDDTCNCSWHETLAGVNRLCASTNDRENQSRGCALIVLVVAVCCAAYFQEYRTFWMVVAGLILSSYSAADADRAFRGGRIVTGVYESVMAFALVAAIVWLLLGSLT